MYPCVLKIRQIIIFLLLLQGLNLENIDLSGVQTHPQPLSTYLDVIHAISKI